MNKKGYKKILKMLIGIFPKKRKIKKNYLKLYSLRKEQSYHQESDDL